jgi:hypothetical protein
MATKYEPLQRRLRRTPGGRIRFSFKEIEAILGFVLPKSARTHAPWWANVGGSHVQAEAWMGAGWRACQVDVPGEKVTFERAERPADKRAGFAMQETGARFLRDGIEIDRARLTVRAARILADYLDEAGADPNIALSRALEDADLTRRRRMIEWFRTNSPRVPGDSTDIIREERDGR